MANTGNVSFSITDQTKTVTAPVGGVVFVEGETLRGPVGDPIDIISSWSKFKSIFGGYNPNDDFPLLCERMLNAGASLRVNRITDGTETVAGMPSSRFFTFNKEFAATHTAKITIDTVDSATVTFGGDLSTHPLFMAALVAAIRDHAKVGSCTYYDMGAGVDDYVLVVTPKAGQTWSAPPAITTGGTTPPTATGAAKAEVTSKNITGTMWFKFVARNGGAEYNKVYIEISAPSNGVTNYFDVNVYHTEDGLLETYKNQIATVAVGGTPAYLTDIKSKSKVIDVEYTDPIATGTYVPVYATYSLSGGTDGGTPDLADYVGDSASGLGFYAFDPYDDAYSIAVPSKSDSDLAGLASAGAAYSAARGDLKYVHHIDNDNSTSTDIMTERDDTAVVHHLTMFTAGGLKIIDPVLGNTKEISELADVMALEAKVLKSRTPWLSFTGMTRGVILNCLGVVNNFGTSAKYAELNYLANDQVNMVILRNGQVMLWDDYTSQKVDSQLIFASIVNLDLYIRKGLKPTLETYLGDPCDLELADQVYLSAKPFLDQIKNNRGFFDYAWLGDQDAESLESMQINTPEDMALGKYKVLLKIKPIAPLKEFTVEIYLTPAGVQFS